MNSSHTSHENAAEVFRPGHNGTLALLGARLLLLKAGAIALLRLQVDGPLVAPVDLAGVVTKALVNTGFLCLLLEVPPLERQRIVTLVRGDHAGAFITVVALDFAEMCHVMPFRLDTAHQNWTGCD